MEPTKDLISFLAFVSFFPQLVAGPIERAKDLLPQFYQHRHFSESLAKSGMRQILWGLFKKIVIADNCSTYANYIFQNYQEVNPSLLIFGAFYFAFQIYCDFSGYSDIAIGTARLFGFNLSRNFAYPYFSRDVGEFWRRWHISLSTWFRDYVYIPLGGNRLSKLKTITNTLIVFGVSGLWHGANWTFIVWGILNGLYLLPLMLINIHKKNTGIVAENSLFPSFKELIQILLTFILTLIAWVFFRSENLSSAFSYLSLMFDVSNYSIPRNIGMGTMFPLILILVMSEWFQRRKNFALEIENLPVLLRWMIYFALTGLIAYHSSEQDLSFIYFQF